MPPKLYRTLPAEDQHDILIEFYQAQERDHYCHSLNLTRYDDLLRTLPADDPFRLRIDTLRAETVSRLAEVTAILDRTSAQLPTAAEVDAALARLKAKRAP